MKTHSVALTFVVAILMTTADSAVAQNRGISGQKAPELKVDKWVQLPKTARAAKTKNVKISDFKGKVVYMFFFQVHCPSCRELGFPSIRTLKEKYAKDKDVAFVAIQTTHSSNSSIDNPTRAKALAQKFRLQGIAVGHSTSTRDKSIFKTYKPGGTPWVVLVDKHGVVRYNDYFLDPTQAAKKIESLKKL